MGMIWLGEKIRSLDRSARSQSQYRLLYHGPPVANSLTPCLFRKGRDQSEEILGYEIYVRAIVFRLSVGVRDILFFIASRTSLETIQSHFI
jgi:hypothetical protein